MTYDDLMDGREQQFALEHEAEAIRVRNEARTAFAHRAAWETGEDTIATIRRICAASGVIVTDATPVECVKRLAREHAARGAMVNVLRHQCERGAIAAGATMYTSEPLPDRRSVFFSMDGRYWASAEDARRQDLDQAAAEAAEMAIERAAAQADEAQHAAARNAQRAA
jgi:hypothetical protein